METAFVDQLPVATVGNSEQITYPGYSDWNEWAAAMYKQWSGYPKRILLQKFPDLVQRFGMDDMIADANIPFLNALRKWNPQRKSAKTGNAVLFNTYLFRALCNHFEQIRRHAQSKFGWSKINYLEETLSEYEDRLGHEYENEHEQEREEKSYHQQIRKQVEDCVDLIQDGLQKLIFCMRYGILGAPQLTMKQIAERLTIPEEKVRKQVAKSVRQIRSGKKAKVEEDLFAAIEAEAA